MAWRVRYDRILSREGDNLSILLPSPMAWKLRSYAFLKLYPEQGRRESVCFTSVSYALEAQTLFICTTVP